jgi:hypothetical protein
MTHTRTILFGLAAYLVTAAALIGWSIALGTAPFA